MPVVQSPLFSLKAKGTIGDLLTYTSGYGKAIVKGNRLVLNDTFSFDVKKYFSQTLEQQIVRSAFKETIGNWNILTPEQKEVYKDKAKGKNTTAIGLYIQENFNSNYSPASERNEYLEDIMTGFIQDMEDVNRINTRMLAYIQVFE